MGTCSPDRYSPPDLLRVSLVMVFKPLADWKVWLLSMGMFEERSGQLLYGCLVVERRSDWMTRPT